MKQLLFILILLPAQLQSKLVGENLNDTLRIEVNAIHSSLDMQQNIYAVDRDQRIIKYNRKGEILNFYQNNRLGKIQQIDVANPHKILIFYKDQQSIVFLDRNMIEVSRIDLNRFGLPEFSTAAVSNDNQIWFFDEFENELKKMDISGNIRTISENTIGIWGESLHITKIRERFNRVFLLDSNKGIFIFDNLGNPLQTINLTGLTDFSVFNANTLIVNHRKKGMGFYSLSEDRFLPIEWPENLAHLNINQLSMSANNWLIKTEEELIYVGQ